MLGLALDLWRGAKGIGGSGTPTALLVVMLGESNAGGYAENTDLTATELAARSVVQMWHNTSDEFQDLDIGTNNLISHTVLTDNATHGLENGFANTVAAGRWGRSQIHLLKTGQGGSTVAQWAAAAPEGYWTTAAGRISDVLTALADYDVTPIVVLSIGKNDAIAGTSETNFKNGLTALLAELRDDLGAGTHVYLTHLIAPTYATYNGYIDDVIALDGNATAFDLSDSDLRDGNHWNAMGFRIGAENLLDAYNGASGTLAAPTISPATQSGLSGTTEVTISGPAGATIYYTTDGSTPTTGGTSQVYSAAFNITDTTTVKAIAVQAGWKNSSADTSTLTYSVTYVSWEATVEATQNGDYLEHDVTSTPSGGRATTTIDPTAAFDVIITCDSNDLSGGVVVYLDEVDTANYNWDGTNDFLFGVFNISNGQYKALIGGSANSIDANSTFPMLMRLRKSGNDIIVAISTDGGDNWTDTETQVGILSGAANPLYVKALFAVGGAAKRIAVQVDQ